MHELRQALHSKFVLSDFCTSSSLHHYDDPAQFELSSSSAVVCKDVDTYIEISGQRAVWVTSRGTFCAFPGALFRILFYLSSFDGHINKRSVIAQLSKYASIHTTPKCRYTCS